MYQNKKELLDTIQEKFPQLGRGQKKVAQYVLNNSEEVAFLTAAQLGKNVGVSEATVVRFAAFLGYNGFPDFQSCIQNMMRQDITTITRLEKRAELQSEQTHMSILHAILEADQTNLNLFGADTTAEQFEQAVDMIVKARKIYICGLRSSYPPAFFLWFSLRYFLHRKVQMLKLGIGDLPEQLMFADERDILIAVSVKRYTKSTISIADALKKRGVTIVTIADNVMAPITPLADLQFTVRSDVSSFIESQVVPMSLINALVTAVALKQKQEAVKELGALEEGLKEFDTHYA